MSGKASLDALYLVSNGFSARMVLHSLIPDEAERQGLSIGVLCPSGDDDAVVELARSRGVSGYGVRSPTVAQELLTSDIQRYLFEDVMGNPALKARHLTRMDAGTRRVFRYSSPVLAGLNRVAQSFAPLPRLAAKLQTKLLRSEKIASLLESINPKTVVATYPVNPFEAVALNEAKRLGIHTTIHLLSWDNISSKGRFPVAADSYVSWGPIMTGELHEKYRVRASEVFECGVPHFDAHQKKRTSTEVASEVAQVGLDPSRPYLFFGMSSPIFAPREIDIVEWLAKRVSENAFGSEMQLLVRPHPQNVTGNMADTSWLPRLKALSNSRVAVDYPKLNRSKLQWNLHTDDLEHLVRLIHGCRVSLNSGSTLAIDAILQDKPVILTPFDANDDSIPWHKSARRLPEYTHLRKLIELGGLRCASDFDSLAAAIHRYIAAPRLDEEGRSKTRKEQCGECDGRAAERVVKALGEICNRVSGPFELAS